MTTYTTFSLESNELLLAISEDAAHQLRQLADSQIENDAFSITSSYGDGVQIKTTQAITEVASSASVAIETLLDELRKTQEQVIRQAARLQEMDYLLSLKSGPEYLKVG
ncbi:hypothetical protein [Pluralibacter gergoviae]|uniref:Uncharacterized protein n=1 Tax=Pluralibacter gergoviae TaxID=61647 RepID=A0A0J5M1R3_PLUGE|nr:hypothetical protein [Pluralibacter gergoviae]AVR03085.1 hypothetical protein A8H26_10480 [Pluralibacter gergoviae]ELC3072870.1 hypothetical protein [Pluralibacter gergoviae]ELG9930450.1 hypothetical protein [Pluralibacter gergoviae]ELK5594978.1 hypothetical protein [Pluralibacter gergoviae]KMK03982.1 hypothetical protein ABW08_12635 [Pluralibacter gergoviae]